MIELANLHLVTGFAGQEHVTAADQGAFHVTTMGSGQHVINTGNLFATTIVSNNQVQVLDGEIYMHGRYIRLEPNTYVDLTIENGAQGYFRNDLIVARYTKAVATGVEEANLVVIKGENAESNPVDPEYVTGNILEGALQNDLPLFRVTIDGLTVTGVECLFTTKDFALDRKQDATNLLAEESTLSDADHIPFYDASAKANRKATWKKVKSDIISIKHNHSTEDINSGVLPIERGGTGVATLAALKSLSASEAVGDIKTTVRTDLGENWLLCNGYPVPKGEYPVLHDMLINPSPYGYVEVPGTTGYGDTMIPTNKPGVWWIRESSLKTTTYLFDRNTLEFTAITAPVAFFGMDWDGERWVAGHANGTLDLYTSTDLVTWTKAAALSTNKAIKHSNTYTPSRLLFDGVSYRVNLNYDGYQNGLVFTVSKDFSTISSANQTSTGNPIQYSDGLFVIADGSDTRYLGLYAPGETSRLMQVYVANKWTSVQKIKDDWYVISPWYSGDDSIRYYIKSTNKLKTIYIYNILGVSSGTTCRNFGCWLDKETNELVFSIKKGDSTYHVFRISVDSDLADTSQYRIENVSSQAFDHSGAPYTSSDFERMYESGSLVASSKIMSAMNYIKFLPSIATERAYTYIKAKD